MKIGALIVTTGLPGVSGVAALMPDAGAITAGQRMISAFQRAGVSLVGLVVGPEDKKAERQFVQNGVVFLRCEKQADYFQGICHGLSFMLEKFDRVFLVPGDTPLFLPRTAEALLGSTANIAVPESSHVNGYPILLDKKGMEFVLSQKNFEAAQRAVRESDLSVETVRVNDSGIMLKCADMTHKKRLIQKHNTQLARSVAEVTLCTGSPLYDARLSMLLHLVDDTRSVRDACSLMQISYSAAWNLLNRVEDELGFPLVTRIRGGSTGSGSVLTEKGRALMDAYVALKQGVRHAAKVGYNFVLNLIRKEDFCYRRINTIKTSDAKLWFMKLQKDGRGYSTITSVRGVVKPAFQMACDEDIIRKNPFAFSLAGVVVNDSKKRQALTPEEQEIFMTFVREDSHYHCYYDEFNVLLGTGMRVSEFCGLTLSDLDFENRKIRVEKQLIKEKGAFTMWRKPRPRAVYGLSLCRTRYTGV